MQAVRRTRKTPARQLTWHERQKAKAKLSWRPRRKAGGVYCSPACGNGCTREEYDAARRDAAKLAKRMGRRWRPHVWENLGWRYSVEIKDGTGQVVARVHSKTGGKHWCEVFIGGHQHNADHADPRKAYATVITRAHETLDFLPSAT